MKNTTILLTKQLNILQKEAYNELGSQIIMSQNQDFAIFPKHYYDQGGTFIKNPTPKYDFCFIGGIRNSHKQFNNRKWILSFIKKNFNNNSYLKFTDIITKTSSKYAAGITLGPYDHTLDVTNGSRIQEPLSFDEDYFHIMKQCQFCLAPAG